MTKSPIIILTDDDEDDRDFFRMAVEDTNAGYHLVMFPDGPSLKQYLAGEKGQQPHILFLDINMPKLNGFQVLEHVRQHYTPQQLPVIMYTTSGSDTDRDLSMKLGANLYVKKPSDYKMLKKLIGDAINQVMA